jgi:2-oxoisovalerate dehydrogenase E1 component alpha subunit
MSIVAEFKIEHIQFISPDGSTTQALPEFAKEIKNLIAMYRFMTLIRVLDAKAVNLQRMGKMGTYPSSLGQEAISIGLAFGMQQKDIFVPYYRDQGAMIQRGVKISEILRFWGGDERANNYADPQVREDFPIAVPVGSQNLHAAGVGFAVKYHKQKRAVVCTCGDGGTSKGDFYEAMNFAGVEQLPVVFIVNNNQWAISVSRRNQTHAQTIAQKAIACGFEGIQVDGNDVVAMRYATEQACEKARAGKGPTLIEAMSYRLCDHTTADDARRYIAEQELKDAWQFEPILRLRNYLLKQNAWNETEEAKLLKECAAEVDQAVNDYLHYPPQEPTAMFDNLYAKLPEELIAQREEVQ